MGKAWRDGNYDAGVVSYVRGSLDYVASSYVERENPKRTHNSSPGVDRAGMLSALLKHRVLYWSPPLEAPGHQVLPSEGPEEA